MRVVGAAGPSCGLGQWIPIVGGVNVRPDLPSGTSARAPLCVGADGTSWLGVPRAQLGHGVKTKGVISKVLSLRLKYDSGQKYK